MGGEGRKKRGEMRGRERKRKTMNERKYMRWWRRGEMVEEG